MIKFIKHHWSVLMQMLHSKVDDMEMSFAMAEIEYSGAGRNSHPTTYDRYEKYHLPPKEKKIA